MAFSDTTEAGPLLRSILPPDVSATIAGPSLQVVPGSFVDKVLRERRTDILYSAETHSGRLRLLYLLLEHQSSVDPMMAFRMYEYIALILGRWRRQHPDGRVLPRVVPIVLYAGARPWNAPTAVEDLFGGKATHWTPRMSFILDDLSQLPDQALSERALRVFGDVCLRVLKDLPRSPDPVRVLMQLRPLLVRLVAAPNGLDRLVSVLEYLSRVANLDLRDVRGLVRQIRPAEEETVMTTLAQRMEQAAFLKGQRQLTLLQLKLKFGEPLPDAVVATVEAGTETDFRRWVERILLANTLDQVFEDSPLG